MRSWAAALSSGPSGNRRLTMRFAIATLGCKVNQYDSAIIESRLGALGLRSRRVQRTRRCLYRQHLHRYRSRRQRKPAHRAPRTPAQSQRPHRHDRMSRAGESRSSRAPSRGGCDRRPGPARRSRACGDGQFVRAGDGFESAQGARADRAARGHAGGPFTRVSQAAGRMRSILYFLYCSVLARDVAQRRAAPHRRSDR